jgi:hypothetical protein
MPFNIYISLLALLELLTFSPVFLSFLYLFSGFLLL